MHERLLGSIRMGCFPRRELQVGTHGRHALHSLLFGDTSTVQA